MRSDRTHCNGQNYTRNKNIRDAIWIRILNVSVVAVGCDGNKRFDDAVSAHGDNRCKKSRVICGLVVWRNRKINRPNIKLIRKELNKFNLL